MNPLQYHLRLAVLFSAPVGFLTVYQLYKTQKSNIIFRLISLYLKSLSDLVFAIHGPSHHHNLCVIWVLLWVVVLIWFTPLPASESSPLLWVTHSFQKEFSFPYYALALILAFLSLALCRLPIAPEAFPRSSCPSFRIFAFSRFNVSTQARGPLFPAFLVSVVDADWTLLRVRLGWQSLPLDSLRLASFASMRRSLPHQYSLSRTLLPFLRLRVSGRFPVSLALLPSIPILTMFGSPCFFCLLLALPRPLLILFLLLFPSSSAGFSTLSERRDIYTQTAWHLFYESFSSLNGFRRYQVL